MPGLGQNPHEIPGLPQVPWGEEGVGGALVGTTCSTPDTMHVVLGGVGIVIVDDELDIFHIFLDQEESVLKHRERGKGENPE